MVADQAPVKLACKCLAVGPGVLGRDMQHGGLGRGVPLRGSCRGEGTSPLSIWQGLGLGCMVATEAGVRKGWGSWLLGYRQVLVMRGTRPGELALVPPSDLLPHWM